LARNHCCLARKINGGNASSMRICERAKINETDSLSRST
jgi:hypothetical protein